MGLPRAADHAPTGATIVIHAPTEIAGPLRCDQCGNPEHVKEPPAA